MEFIGQRLKEIRQINGLSQNQIAEYLGIDQESVDEIEKGTKNIGAALIDKLEDLYFCTYEQLSDKEKYIPTPMLSNLNNPSKNDLYNISKIGRIAKNLETMCAIKKRKS